MNKTATKYLVTATLAVILLCLFTALLLPFATASAEQVNLDEWEVLEVLCTNSINDFSFTYKGYSRFSTYTGQYEVRIYNEELEGKAHYLYIDGYDFANFADWTTTDGYIMRRVNTKKSAVINAQYTVRNVDLKFIDSITNEELASFSISYGGSIVPPAPNDYTAQGLIFSHWDGGSYENATRTATLYTVYAPARYVTVIMPDETAVKLAVAKGSTLNEMTMPEYGNKVFKKFKDENGTTVDGNIAIDYDITLYATYGSKPMPKWAWAIIAGVGVAVLCAIIIPFIVRKIKSRV